jgi:hypothetical protein
MSKIAIQEKRMGQNRMRNGIINGTGFVFKIPLITIHENKREMVNVIP